MGHEEMLPFSLGLVVIGMRLLMPILKVKSQLNPEQTQTLKWLKQQIDAVQPKEDSKKEPTPEPFTPGA